MTDQVDNTPEATGDEGVTIQVPGPRLYARTTYKEEGKVHRVQVMNGVAPDKTVCGLEWDHAITNEQAEVLDESDLCSRCSD